MKWNTFIRKFIACSIICLASQVLFAGSGDTDKHADSLKLLLKSATGNKKIDILNKISFYTAFSNPDTADRYARQAFELAEKAGYKKGKSVALNCLGINMRYKGLYDDAITYSDSAISVCEDCPAQVNASAYMNIGAAYRGKGANDKALENYLKAIELFKEANEKTELATAYNNVGVIYMYREEYSQAIDYYNQALHIQQQEKNLKGQAETFNNFAIVFARKDELDSALVYFEKSFEIEKERGSKLGMAECIGNIAGVFYYMGDIDKSIEQYNTAFELYKEMDNTQGQVLTFNNIGIIYSEKGQYQKALEYINRALALAKSIDSKYDIKDSYANLIDVYTAMGDYKTALEYYGKYFAVNDSILNSEQGKAIARMETLYKTKEKEAHIAIQELEIQEKENALIVKRNLIWTLILIMALVVLGGFVFYQRYKAKKDAQIQNSIIAEREAGLKAVFDATEEERKRIAKDLHDGVGQQMSGLKMAWQNLSIQLASVAPDQQETLRKLTTILDEAAGEVRSISHQMMPRALSELGLVPAMEDMLEKAFLGSAIQYDFEQHGAKQRFDERIEVGLYRVCQELINNVIKHSNAKQVSVQLFKNNKQLILIVEDNGVGFDATRKQEGIGLLNMSSRLNTFNGKINFEPSPGSGTTATIRIPL